MGQLIVLNCLTIVLQQEIGNEEDSTSLIVFTVLENLFTATFTSELIVRIRA